MPQCRALRYRPRVVAVLGVGAYQDAFGRTRTRVRIGEQPERIGNTRFWVLPNPSGLNANYQLPRPRAAFPEAVHSGGEE